MVLEPATTTTNKIYYYCFNIKKICQYAKYKKIEENL